jgi:protein-tyrosine phosphatase
MIVKLKRFVPGFLKRRVKLFLRNSSDSISYFFLKARASSSSKPKHIIFVCKGNICRSAFAEHYMKTIAEGLDVKIGSYGLDVDQGKYPPREAINTAETFGIDISKHISQKLYKADVENADLIISMEYGQYQRLVELYPEKKNFIKLLKKYAPFPYSVFCNIDDPFGCEQDEFIKSFNLIHKSIEGLCQELER